MPEQGLTTACTLNDEVQCHILVSKTTIGKMIRFTIDEKLFARIFLIYV